MDLLTKDKNVAWYVERPSEQQLTPAARELLAKYSGIPLEKVEDHVVAIRDAAWEICPYPCIGRFRFLDLSFAKSAVYPEVLQRLRDGQRLLDIGCCFGQAIRQLVLDGAPSENLWGCDLEGKFIELGYDLFGDRDTLKSTFVTANILDATSALSDLEGQFDMVFAGSFFHLWGYDDQVKVSKLVAALLRPQKGSMVFGRQVGTLSGFGPGQANTKEQMFQHNVETFKKMWKDISEDVGETFAVDAELSVPNEVPQWSDEKLNDVRRLNFTVRRA
jgi:SAM-dependent methyltransferase